MYHSESSANSHTYTHALLTLHCCSPKFCKELNFVDQQFWEILCKQFTISACDTEGSSLQKCNLYRLRHVTRIANIKPSLGFYSVCVCVVYLHYHLSAGSPPPEVAGGAAAAVAGVLVCGGKCGDLSCSLSFSSPITLTQHIQFSQLLCTAVSQTTHVRIS